MAMAPFTPFLSEELYRKLTDGESVHLLDWPEFGHVNEELIDRMAVLRKLISGGLELRAKASIKNRQPLSSASLGWSREFGDDLLEIAREELNVKEIEFKKLAKDNSEVTLDQHLTPALKREGLMREVIRQVQKARKDAGLQVDDRIRLVLKTEDKELIKAIEEHAEIIKQETLATKLTSKGGQAKYTTTVSIEAAELEVAITKSS